MILKKNIKNKRSLYISFLFVLGIFIHLFHISIKKLKGSRGAKNKKTFIKKIKLIKKIINNFKIIIKMNLMK